MNRRVCALLCFRRGEPLFCENFSAKGVAMDGGFAEYVT